MSEAQNKNSTALSDEDYISIKSLREFIAAITYLAEISPAGMSVSQLVFFLHAGMADLKGRPTTFTKIRDHAGPSVNRSLHTTYKSLLKGNRRSDKPRSALRGLNWLWREENPLDNRQKLLHLTPEGRAVFRKIIEKL